MLREVRPISLGTEGGCGRRKRKSATEREERRYAGCARTVWMKTKKEKKLGQCSMEQKKMQGQRGKQPTQWTSEQAIKGARLNNHIIISRN